MGSLCINHERPESLIALCDFPEEHNHLRRELGVALVSRDVGCGCKEWLIENSRHAINDELKILWTM
jgi:hypothetical protein